jgi:hypothetical protein
MAAEASSGTNQRLTLDHTSFERLLAAAWVLQCLQDQLHGPPVDRDDPVAEPVKIQQQLETPRSSLQAITESLPESTLRMADASSEHAQLIVPPTANNSVVESAKVLPPLQMETRNVDPDVMIAPESVEPKESLRSENIATLNPINTPVPLWTNHTNNDGETWAKFRAAFNLQSANLRNTFNRALDAIPNPLPNFRITFSMRALRAVAIATPVWVLSLVAALLFLEVWRHGSFQSAQATSRPNPPIVTAAATNPSTTLTTTTLTTTTQPEPPDVKPLINQTRQSNATTPLETSHKRITDGATQSAVAQLSRYEIKGLRRRAKYGDDSAAFTLGMAYEVGHSVPQNCVEAAHWVATAAEAGDAAAQYNLGLRYRDGDGVPANRTESEQWLRRAAAHRNQQAKHALKMLASR